MNIQHNGYPVAVSQQLTSIIDRELEVQDVDTSLGFIILFRDSGYNAESGGYHPVEICVDAQSRIKTITDYAYMGYGPHAQLTKELEHFSVSQKHSLSF